MTCGFSDISMIMFCFALLASLGALVAGLSPKFSAPRALLPIGAVSAVATSETTELYAEPFLRSILSSRTNAQKKKDLLKNLQSLRMNQPSVNQTLYSDFVDSLLLEVDAVEGNKWAMFRYPLPIPSYRVKLGALRRVLDKFLEDETVDVSNPSAVLSSRRRALSIILNQLQYVRSIRSMEAEASRSLTSNTMEDMLTRTPQGLETPKYKVLDAKKAWEVRKYESFSVCSTFMNVNEAGPGSFNALAGYIFGKNQPQEKMAMTTPVLSTTSSSQRKMSFVMPSRFWTDTTAAPRPVDGSVLLEGDGGGLTAASSTIAVKWFGGFATANVVARQSSALLAGLKECDVWEVVEPDGTPFLMQYNDPFQPPWKRRNEVAIAVRAKGK